jgi:hypothetical protein
MDIYLAIIFHARRNDTFSSIAEFNDGFASSMQAWLPKSKEFENPCRKLLSDNGTIKITHANLHRSNIMISSATLARLCHCGLGPDGMVSGLLGVLQSALH